MAAIRTGYKAPMKYALGVLGLAALIVGTCAWRSISRIEWVETRTP